MKEKFPDICSWEQATKIKELLGADTCNNIVFRIDYIFKVLPKEITYNGHRGDLAITTQDISYFSVGGSWEHILVHFESIPVGGDIFDAFISMLEWLKDNNLIQ